MSDTVCQFSYGDKVMFRLYGTGDAIPGYITAVDIPTRRVRICYGENYVEWVYFEHCYKQESK